MAIYAIFFLSGVAGLIYEVSWTRQVGLLFGQTVQSAAVVLSCYFFGMALGYKLAARWVEKVKPLTGYAIAELVVAAWAFVVPLLLKFAASPGVSGLLNAESPTIQILVRAVASFVLLLPATVALGATLPFIAEAVKGLALAYALNVAGAFFGVIVGTMYLIEAVGVAGSSYVAAALSAFCALIALVLRKPRETKPAMQTETFGLKSRWTWLAAVSGFGVLALQVLYIRLFSLVLHNSVYSFGAVVAVFLVALAIGSAFVSRFAPRLDAETGLPFALQAGGVAAVSSMLLFILWTGLEYFTAGVGFHEYVAGVFGFSFAVIIVPVTLAGVVLPWVWHAASAQNGAAVGSLAAVNTLAAAAGSAIASFVLLPLAGLWLSFVIVGLVYVAAGIFLFPSQRKPAGYATFAAIIAFCGVSLVAAGRYQGLEPNETLVDRWESAYGWVDVVEFTDRKNRQLRQNVHYGLGSSSSITMERRQSHIPLLLHPNPKDVMYIGLATGITAGAGLDHPMVERMDVVELIPDVVRGAKLFSEVNRNVVESPRANIMINDGRHHLYATDKQYDVVIADLFVPWESHTGYLYTVEHFEAARKKLKPGGLYCQWIPLWQLGETEARLIADSFAAVFPVVTVWYGKLHEHWTILGFIGSEQPLTVDAQAVAARLALPPTPALPKDESWFATPRELFDLYAGDWQRDPLKTLNTDERPRVEFSTPITAWTKGARLRFGTLKAFQKDVLSGLPSTNVSYAAAPGEIPPDAVAIRAEHTRILEAK